VSRASSKNVVYIKYAPGKDAIHTFAKINHCHKHLEKYLDRLFCWYESLCYFLTPVLTSMPVTTPWSCELHEIWLYFSVAFTFIMLVGLHIRFSSRYLIWNYDTGMNSGIRSIFTYVLSTCFFSIIFRWPLYSFVVKFTVNFVFNSRDDIFCNSLFMETNMCCCTIKWVQIPLEFSLYFHFSFHCWW
jgi:hypothetical protein